MKVAIVGAGPAGKAAARRLSGAGLAVTVFDREAEGGGLLRYGYPDARMPTGTSRRDTARLEALGVDFRFGQELGKDVTLAELETSHDAVLLAIGSTVPRRLGIPGEDLPGVYQARWLLHQARNGQPPKVGPRVLIIGGGDTSVDTATTALELGGTEVAILYRGALVDLRAQEREVAMARGAGVSIEERTTVQRITLAAGRLAVALRKEGASLTAQADTVIVAIGQEINQALYDRVGVTVRTDGTTSRPNVFVAGESLYGPKLLAGAILDGRRAADQILAFLDR